MFCDSVFEWIEFEQVLYFAALDVEFHSGLTASQDLFAVNLKHFSQMTINEQLSTQPEKFEPPPTEAEIAQILTEAQTVHRDEATACYDKLSQILFSPSTPSATAESDF